MAKCDICGKEMFRIRLVGGTCLKCIEASNAADAEHKAAQIKARADDERAAITAATSRIILTTETAHNLQVDQRLDIVTAEVVIGMHLFKDIASAFRDTFGGRSKAMQDGMREARIAALTELRLEAVALGADAVVGVDLDYSEISGGGKSMLFLVASGTAVTLKADTKAMQ